MVAGLCNELSWWYSICTEPTWVLGGQFSRARGPSWSCPPWSDRLPRPSRSHRPGTVSPALHTRWCSTSWGENPGPRRSRTLHKVYPHLQNTKQLNNHTLVFKSFFFSFFIRSQFFKLSIAMYIWMYCGISKKMEIGKFILE